jgi:outer membrane lipoprotein-sorting protein
MKVWNYQLTMRSSFLFFLLLSSPIQVSAGDGPGAKLAQQVYDRPVGRDAVSRVTMILSGKGVQTRKRELALYSLDKGGGERWSLMRFFTPADVKDTGLLTMDYPGDESDQWLYLPALDRVRRISSSRKGGRFVGSDFYYEDLRDREPDMDTHQLLGKGKVGKVACDILLSRPVDPDNSTYSKRVSWIHRKTLTPLRVDFYKKGKKKPVKRLLARRLKKIQGYWVVLQSTMYDLRTGHKTQLATSRIQFDQGIPESLFSRQGLSDPSREKQYLPR